MASMLTCEICLEKKSDRKPKSLNCLHSFCRDCLASWVDARAKEADIEFPVCRQHTKIPDRGVDGLVDDFKVIQLEEMITSIGDPLICQGCLAKGQTSKATVKCETCDRRLCDSCHQYHLSQKIFKRHQIATDLCEVHGNAISHVCITCFTGACVDCLLTEVHHDHDMNELDEGMQKMSESVWESQRQLSDLSENIRLKMKRAEVKTDQTMEINIAKLKQSAESVIQEIYRHVEGVIKRYRHQTIQHLQASFDEFQEQHLLYSFDELEQETNPEEIENIQKIIDYKTELNRKIRHVIDAGKNVPEMSEIPSIDDLLRETGKPVSVHQYFRKINTSATDAVLRETLFEYIPDKPKLVLEKLSKKSDEISLPEALEMMDDFTAIVLLYRKDHAGRFGVDGKKLASYDCDGQKGNKLLTESNGNIFIFIPS